MILYHGSLVTVEKPRILHRTGERGTDFGIGFYTTSSKEQAEKWVHIRQRKAGVKTPGFVSVYSVPDNLMQLTDLLTLEFTDANSDWLHFLSQNRTATSLVHSYDIVHGPVANDRVYTTLTLWEDGFVDEEQTLLRLKTFLLADQYLVHTEKSLQILTFQKAEVIP